MMRRLVAFALVSFALASCAGSCGTKWSRTAKCEGFADCNAKCDAGDGYACASAARLLDDGEYVKRDAAGAEALLRRGCDLGASRACSRLALVVHARVGDDAEEKELRRRAFEARRTACEKERLIDVCSSLVSDYESGWDTTTKEGQDIARGEQLKQDVLEGLKAQCDGGLADACLDLAWLVKRTPEGKPPNISQALPHYKRACTLDRTNCWLYGDALGDMKDSAGARAAIAEACDADTDGSSCYFPNQPLDTELASKRFEKRRASCDKGHRVSCLELGDKPPDGWPDPRSAEQRKHDWEAANAISAVECEAGMIDSCERAISALPLDSEGNLARGKALLELALLEEKTCALGSKSACSSLKREPLLRNVTALYPGKFHSCAQQASSGVACWGVPSSGATGVDDNGSWGPNPIKLDQPAADVVTTQSGACALLADSTVRCWGKSPVKDSDKDHRPYAVPELAGAKQLAASDDGYELCATFDKRVSCYREGASKPRSFEGIDQLIPVNYGEVIRKGQALSWARDGVANAEFARLPASASIDATTHGLCALSSDGTVACAEIALDSQPNGRPFKLAQVAEVTGAVQISMVARNACALSKAGTVSCWTLPNTDVKQLPDLDDAIELKNACAVTKRGLVFCWGGRLNVPWGTVEVLRVSPSAVETQ